MTVGAAQAAVLLASDLCLAYPCTSAPIAQTLGVTTVGALTDAVAGALNGSRVVTSALGGHVVSLSVYVRGPLDVVANRSWQGYIYTDAITPGGLHRPDRLVAASATKNLVTGWNTVTFAVPPSLLPQTSYFLMVNNAGVAANTNRAAYARGVLADGAWSTAPVAFGTAPATFPAATVTDFKFSIYATLMP